jgi:transcriptional regulator with GAF, ATPase, and Fis domain
MIQPQVPSVVKEITELDQLLKKLPDMMNTKHQLASTFETIYQKLQQGEHYEEILDNVFDALDPLIPYVRIGIALLENNDEDIRLLWVKSKLPIKGLKKNYVAQLSNSSLMKIFETGEPRIINDLHAYLRLHPDSKSTEHALEDGIMSSLTCPLVIDGKNLGFIYFSSVNTFTYKNVHKEIYKEIARGLSIIVEHELRRSKSFKETIQKDADVNFH